MAEREYRDLSGALFRNDRKQSEKHPDYRGSLRIDGVEYTLAGWIRVSKNGTKYLSLAVSRPDGGQTSRGRRERTSEAEW